MTKKQQSLPPANPNSQSAEFQNIERRAKWFWGTLIVGLLSTQVAIGAASIYLSVGDPSVAVIPNYHQRALNWDVQQRAKDLIRKAGWDIRAQVTPAEANQEERKVTITIIDSQKKPVAGVRVEASMFHLARGSEIAKIVLPETSPGVYSAVTKLHKTGLWQIDLHVEGNEGIGFHSIEIAAP